MKIGFISTRLAGTDGVSLEADKLAEVLRTMGHKTYYCAGKLSQEDPKNYLVPRMSFNHPEIDKIQENAFSQNPQIDVEKYIRSLSAELKREIANFVDKYGIDIIFTQNAQSIPMNLPLGVALSEFIEDYSFPTIAHHHDFWWERERFTPSQVKGILDKHFPPKQKSSRDLVINSIAKKELEEKKNLKPMVLPNIFNFSRSSPKIDAFNKDLRERIGLEEGETFFLQPTRVVPRKGIEQSIRLLEQLPEKSKKLVITHDAGDEGMTYLKKLQNLARESGVTLKYVADMFGESREYEQPKKYSLWDAYLHADFVTYPSKKEGFGNALLETVFFKVPALVNRYPVYKADIEPLGFDFVKMDGSLTPSVVSSVKKVLQDEELQAKMVDKNFRLAKENFSYEVAKSLLKDVIDSF